MSYDLFFFPPPETAIAEADLLAYFRKRPNYRVEGSQAWYSNEDTGVYFAFEIGTESLDEMDADGDGPSQSPAFASFNLNFFRPHVFGMEAERELTAFVEAFHCPLFDPQNDGMGSGPYSGAAFLRGWNRGNELGYSSILSAHGLSAAEQTLPTRSIEEIWLWNYGRAALQEAFGPSLFVPKIMLLVADGRLQTAATWPDAIPTTLPRTDLYLVGRKEFAPRKWFSRKQDLALVSRDQIEPLLSQYPLRDEPAPYHLLQYEERPAHLIDWVRSLSSYEGQLTGVSPDKVLNAELVAKYLPA